MAKATDLIVLASGIIFLLLVVLFVELSGPTHSEEKEKTMMLMREVRTALENYKLEYDQPPVAQNLSALMKTLEGDNPRRIEFMLPLSNQLNAQGELLDGWGTPMRISYDAKKELILQSAGPDKQWGTADDLTSE